MQNGYKARMHLIGKTVTTGGEQRVVEEEWWGRDKSRHKMVVSGGVMGGKWY